MLLSYASVHRTLLTKQIDKQRPAHSSVETYKNTTNNITSSDCKCTLSCSHNRGSYIQRLYHKISILSIKYSGYSYLGKRRTAPAWSIPLASTALEWLSSLSSMSFVASISYTVGFVIPFASRARSDRLHRLSPALTR